MKSLGIDRYRRIVVLTGAGISVASGLRPFRGPGGLWDEVGAAELATPQGLRERPAELWRLFGSLRAQALAGQPNAAHLALAELQSRMPAEARLTLVTQNVDGLHQRAGSRDVVELHGSVFRTRCSSTACDLTTSEDLSLHDQSLPHCTRCGSVLRADVVLFEEDIPVDAERRTKHALRDCDFFLAVGTSGTVYPASNFVRSAEYAGARTVLVNLEPMDPPNPAYNEQYLGRAEELLPILLG